MHCETVKTTSCCFLFTSHHMSQLALFFKLFCTAYLWLWTFLLWFWCNVANPPQLKACLKTTAFHRVWFRVRNRNVALSRCGCQDRILLMYAVITWISVMGARNNDTCQHCKERHLEKPTYLWGLIKKFLSCARSQHMKSCDNHVMIVHHLLHSMYCVTVCKFPQVLLLHIVTWFKDSLQWRVFLKDLTNRKSADFYHITVQYLQEAEKKKIKKNLSLVGTHWFL
jgi:hypothetical protein